MRKPFITLVRGLALGCGLLVGMSRSALADDAPPFLLQWGNAGAASASEDTGKFSGPSGIATDSQGNVYVADTRNNRIQKFSNNGVFLSLWGSRGHGAGQFINPYGIAIDANDDVYVAESSTSSLADTANHRVQKFTSDGTFLLAWGTKGIGDGSFNTPRGIAVDGPGNVYVAEWGNSRVQKFTGDGTYLTKWSHGFIGCFGVGADNSGNVYVADYANTAVAKIQKFTSTGTWLTTWGGALGCLDVVTDSVGNIYAPNLGEDYGWIRKFAPTGEVLATWGQYDPADLGMGNFHSPTALTIDRMGNIFVIDNNKVQKFGNAVTAVGPPAEPTGIDLSASPNPASARTTLRFTLPRESGASLAIHDLAGRQVAAWQWPSLAAGRHQVEWARSAAAVGVHFARLTANGQTRTLKLIQLR